MAKSKSSSSRSNRKSIYQFQSTTTTFYHHNSESPTPKTNTVSIPISTDSKALTESTAAVKIQSSYRAHLIKSLTSTIRSVNTEADKLQRTIQQQETVDLIRTNDRERIKLHEALMKLLLRLDSVRGLDPAVRELRKSVSRKVVRLQEVVDAVTSAAEESGGGIEGWWEWEFVRKWEEDLAAIEVEVCRERGGGEMERFCIDKLGFVCFQRFLRGDA